MSQRRWSVLAKVRREIIDFSIERGRHFDDQRPRLRHEKTMQDRPAVRY